MSSTFFAGRPRRNTGDASGDAMPLAKAITPNAPVRRFRPYQEYKDSGVEWLGEIPAHWRAARLKHVFKVINGATPQSGVPAYWDGNIPWVTPEDLGDLDGSEITATRRYITEAGYQSCATTLAPAGSLVLSTRAPIGHLAIAGMDLCTNQGCRSLIFRRAPVRRFFYYQMLAAKAELESLGQGSTFRELAKDKLESLGVVEPTDCEQRAIGAFLDQETAKIDALVERKEKLIAQLQEKRTALINRAVTKGVDPKASMKDSGIEWLGEIPAHWEVKRTKFAARLRSGHTPSRQHPEYWENCTIPWFGLADVWQIRDGRTEYVSETNEKISELGLANSAARLLPRGTVIVSRTASVGFSAIMATDMATTQDFVNWVCGPTLRPEYLLYVFRSMEHEFNRLTMGSTHQTIYMPDVGRFTTPIPPLSEQDRIVTWIRQETGSIDALVHKVRDAIDRLRELRTTMISAAVTGKIDVRGELA